VNQVDDGNSLLLQVRRNLIAILSLIFAVTSLTYTTWRNEQTEDNRNVREAAFEILVELGDLQRVVFFSQYDHDAVVGSPRNGWAYALTIWDLSQVVPEPLPACTATLKEIWGENWQYLGTEEESARKIGSAIDDCRVITLNILRDLH
jgi:hypothetical protein